MPEHAIVGTSDDNKAPPFSGDPLQHRMLARLSVVCLRDTACQHFCRLQLHTANQLTQKLSEKQKVVARCIERCAQELERQPALPQSLGQVCT
jgi:hypothetical protein